MTVATRTLPIRTLRHDGPEGSWAWHRRDPSPRLRSEVLSCAGFEERNVDLRRRRELPPPAVPLILTIEGAVRVRTRGRQDTLGSFVAGPDDTFSVTDLGTRWAGLQVNLTPPSAVAVLGLPLSEVARRTVRLEDLPGAEGSRLVERLGDAGTWRERFDVLDRFLLARIESTPGATPEVSRAWRIMAADGGRSPIGELAREVGWSRQHLSARFTDELGLSPKRFARLIRFDRAVKMARTDPRPPWTAIALRCGYYDQAHMVKDFQEFAGCTPTGFAARLLPADGGVGTE